MTIETRKKEITSEMSSFPQCYLKKEELLPELLKLQSEMVQLTFSEEHAELAGLKIWDVVNHLEQMNQDRGNIASDELIEFRNECFKFSNLIRAEISGCQGENRVLRRLGALKTRNVLVQNVELCKGDEKSELDIVVISPKGVTIIEVKNTQKDIFIDEDGNYFRTGRYQKFDCRILQKMNTREALLKETLDRVGITNVPVSKIVVFTNNQIEVQNRCEQLQTCFLNQLPYLIDDQKGPVLLDAEEIQLAAKVLEESKGRYEFPVGMDVKKFKDDFAGVMAKLECVTESPVDLKAETVVEEERPAITHHAVSYTKEVEQQRRKQGKRREAAKIIGFALRTAAAVLISVNAANAVRNVL